MLFIHRSAFVQVNIRVPRNSMASPFFRRRRFVRSRSNDIKLCKKNVQPLSTISSFIAMQICRFLPVLIGRAASTASADSHLHARTILKGSLAATSSSIPLRSLHARSLTGNFRSRIRTLS